MYKVVKLSDVIGDATLKDSVIINFSDSINIQNFRVLGFQGTANGNSLTRLYKIADIQNYYVRIISLMFFFYADSSLFWMKEAEYDNTLFTPGINTRYKLLRSFQKIEPTFFQDMGQTAQSLKILINGNDQLIFQNTYMPALEKIDLNVTPNLQVQSGIDIQALYQFYDNIETPTYKNPFVIALMPVEILPVNQSSQAKSFI